MSVAKWTPLFVIAEVPVEVVNKVLRSAQQEAERLQSAENFHNRWVVISEPSQQSVTKPTDSVALDFRSGFLDYSLDQIKNYVKSHLGENGLGQGKNSLDHLSDDAFAIINTRTAADNTVLFLIQDFINDVQEAEIRVAWGRANEYDKCITLCSWEEGTDEDLASLLRAIGKGDLTDDAGDKREIIAGYLEQLREESEVLRWFEIRMDAGYSILGNGGLSFKGAADSLIDRDAFGQDGVMRGPTEGHQLA
ncbi:hypothetical protein KCU87_g5023, partial [Aureobasidium melanogenum]